VFGVAVPLVKKRYYPSKPILACVEKTTQIRKNRNGIRFQKLEVRNEKMLLQELLEKAGVDFKQGEGDEVTLNCPFCDTEDTGFHLGLNVGNGLAHCFRCDWKSGGLMNTARQLSEVYKVPFHIRYSALKNELKEEAPKPEKHVRSGGLPKEYEPFVNDPTDKIELRIRGYLKSRGVSQLQITRHKIGFAAVGPYAWRILFPVWGSDGKAYGCVARSIDVRQKPKYLNTPGIKLMWGAHQTAKTAVIVEGVLDALRVEQALMRRKDWIAIARLGSTLSTSQFRQLRQYDRIIILPDKDVAGVKGAIVTAELCAANHIQTEISIPDVLDGRDPGDMTPDEINEYIDLARSWSKSEWYRMRASVMREAV
jgi:DNA primase